MNKELSKYTLIVWILTMLWPIAGIARQQEIIEDVSVDWWLVPLVAVDSQGNAVTNLESKDIRLTVNGRPVTNFNFYRSGYQVEKKTAEERKKAHLPKNNNAGSGPRFVCLLFDMNISGSTGIQRSREIARDIIEKAQPGTRFLLLAIETFSGLRYIAEGNAGDSKLLNELEQKVRPRANPRNVSGGLFGIQISGSKGERLSPSDIRFVNESAANYYVRRSRSFFESFETLYFYLNGIDGGKFVYLLSEGISNSYVHSIKGGDSMYKLWLKKVASNLGRGGAVVFLINPTGLQDDRASTSGERMMRYLAQESGGQYLEGSRTTIVERIQNMQRAVYEISFPDIPGAKGIQRSIDIESTRPGVKLISLRSIEKEKTYGVMNDMEKEIAAVQLVSGSPLLQRRFSAYEAAIAEEKKSKKKTVFSVMLPHVFIGKTLDLYKIYLAREKDSSSAAVVTKILKEEIRPLKSKFNIVFPIEPDITDKGKEKGTNKENKKEQGKEIEKITCFVLVDTAGHTVRVHGLGQYDPDPIIMAQIEEADKKRLIKERTSGEHISMLELERILDGASQYCETLKSSVFHFFCKETVNETRIALSSGRRRGQALNISMQRRDFDPMMRNYGLAGAEKGFANKYVFTYRLIKNENDIKEEREWLTSHDSLRRKRSDVVSARAFFSSKAVFAPVTLLDKNRREMYKYTFLRFENYKGRRAAVIEALPEVQPGEQINGQHRPSVYGDIWIDMEDFSVLRIQADPRSIIGYSQLKEQAKKIHSRLQLSLNIEFGQRSRGIRFPTRLVSSERYKGGRLVSRFWGSDGWERTRTVLTYDDYQFFNVATEVTVENN